MAMSDDRLCGVAVAGVVGVTGIAGDTAILVLRSGVVPPDVNRESAIGDRYEYFLPEYDSFFHSLPPWFRTAGDG